MADILFIRNSPATVAALITAGHTVRVVEDWFPTDERASNPAPDAIVVRVFLPGETGLAVLRRLSAFYAGVPIVALAEQHLAAEAVQLLERSGATRVVQYQPHSMLPSLIASVLRTAP